MSDDLHALYFKVFNEIGILEQLSRTLLEARLPKGFLVSHFTVLNHLIRVRNGQTPLALARAFQVPKTTMTHTLSGLETAALVEIRPNPDDKRSKQVWITPAGRSFRDEAIAALGPDIAHLASLVPEDTVRALAPKLQALREVMDANRSVKI
ncbi:MarR family winged helix-turn-helix transcriptional regulator [Tropicimonas sp. S265A]|uniref:MarR family winged helix-turn-helix transcriptional regulator n=1 Tax=Tropicimonas sp. S265A TaxID=3415134 RepID=UPI003C7C5E72